MYKILLKMLLVLSRQFLGGIYVYSYIICKYIPYFYVYVEEGRAPKKSMLACPWGRREYTACHLPQSNLRWVRGASRMVRLLWSHRSYLFCLFKCKKEKRSHKKTRTKRNTFPGDRNTSGKCFFFLFPFSLLKLQLFH